MGSMLLQSRLCWRASTCLILPSNAWRLTIAAPSISAVRLTSNKASSSGDLPSPPPDPALVARLVTRGIRPYFYHLDIHGQLFLHDTYPRNFTSCFKDPKFLDFFFSRIQPNDRPDDPPDFQGLWPQYQWISPCGKEMNFIEVVDTPIVYHSLRDENLIWGGTKATPFVPENLFVSESTGRIYHALPPQVQQRWSNMKKPPLGLLKSSLVLAELVDKLDGTTFHWKGKHYNIGTIE